MDNKLFLMNGEHAVEVHTKRFDKEADLQKIIRDNPDLLARSMEKGEFKKLYMVKQELPVKVSLDDSNEYSMDHLLVDEDGIPVLVEVKRSTDTRIKREVVGQMLDYACRASKWDKKELREAFQENNKEVDLSHFDDDFWDTVFTNLSAEHFRLVFAADQIPDTLRVMIEFLDRTMRDIEVYGVELKPYEVNESRFLASNVVGNSLMDSTKVTSSSRNVRYFKNPQEFIEEYEKRGMPDLAKVFDEICRFWEQQGYSWESGSGAIQPAYKAKIGDKTLFRIAIWKSGRGYRSVVEFYIDIISRFMNEKEDKDTIRKRLTGLPDIKKDEIDQTPPTTQYIDLHLLEKPANMEYFKAMIQKLASEILAEDSSAE